jgi:plasmid stabilization system protein ParE
MTYDIVILPRAERDIQLAAHWILGQSGSPATAVRWARRLRASIATLKANPQMLEAGIISEIKPPITDLTPYQNRQAIPVQGEPHSEAVIRKRR